MYKITNKIVILTILAIFVFAPISSIAAENLFAKDHVDLVEYDDFDIDSEVLESEESFDIDDLRDEDELLAKENAIPLASKAALKNKLTKNKYSIRDIAYRAGFVIFLLLSLLFIIKGLLYKTSMSGESFFNERPGFLDGITDKFKGTISFDGIKLKQMVALNRGQNLYLVEMDGRKILLGGTHNGGVQFVADLTEIAPGAQLSNIVSSNPEIPEYEYQMTSMPKLTEDMPLEGLEMGSFTPEQLEESNQEASNTSTGKKAFEDPFLRTSEHMDQIEKTRARKKITNIEEKQSQERPKRVSKRPFKRRVNFRQSLIN